MKTNKIRLTESQLHNVIKSSIKKTLMEGEGMFNKLYNDKNAPHSYDDKINELYQKIDDCRRECEERCQELEKELSRYEMWAEDEFKDYASDKYGITSDNLDKNWKNFATNHAPKQPTYHQSEGGRGYAGSY